MCNTFFYNLSSFYLKEKNEIFVSSFFNYFSPNFAPEHHTDISFFSLESPKMTLNI